jgi:hypothetical protein
MLTGASARLLDRALKSVDGRLFKELNVHQCGFGKLKRG